MKKTILLLAMVPFFFLSFAQNTRSTVPTNAREKLGDQKFARLCKMIYAGATTGINGKKINAYQNDLLTTVYTAQEILVKGGKEETAQVPINKNDPNSELIDTVIRSPFRPEDTKSCKLLQEITKSNDPLKYSAEMIAISLTFDLYVSGLNIGEQELFYVKFNDLKTILDEKTYNELVDACIP